VVQKVVIILSYFCRIYRFFSLKKLHFNVQRQTLNNNKDFFYLYNSFFPVPDNVNEVIFEGFV